MLRQSCTRLPLCLSWCSAWHHFEALVGSGDSHISWARLRKNWCFVKPKWYDNRNNFKFLTTIVHLTSSRSGPLAITSSVWLLWVSTRVMCRLSTNATVTMPINKLWIGFNRTIRFLQEARASLQIVARVDHDDSILKYEHDGTISLLLNWLDNLFPLLQRRSHRTGLTVAFRISSTLLIQCNDAYGS